MCSMRTAQWVTRSIVVTAIIAVLSGCSALEPSTLVVTFPDSSDSADAVAGSTADPASTPPPAATDIPAPSDDVKGAIAFTNVAAITYATQNPGKVIPQVDELADYGLDLSELTTTITIYSKELALKFCVEGKTPAGYTYKMAFDEEKTKGPNVVAGTCVEGTDY